MWPDLKETPIEDYEYAVAGADGPSRAPRVFHLSPAVLGSMLGAAFVLGVAAGWFVATLDED
ncbi:hypothetical protein [Phenylobacterium sp.]|uniref:hypothetical protein n=1 Tax=Phenylobacterium sp. TaxID=1871053 RepID=UPI0035AEAA3F